MARVGPQRHITRIYSYNLPTQPSGIITDHLLCILQQTYPYSTLTEVSTLTAVSLNPTEIFLTLTEVFPCFFLSCKTNARVKLVKTGHGPHSSTLVMCSVVIRVVLRIVCV
jgi:hypothetical protein